MSKAWGWPRGWQMPSPRAALNLQMPHPRGLTRRANDLTDALLHCFCCDPQLKLLTDFSMAPSGETSIRINHYFVTARQIYQLQFYG